jgi:hypothetical protein
MAITQAMVTSFKVGVLDGTFDFSSGTSQVFKIALFTSAATLDATTTAYSVTNETSGTGYTAGGNTLTISTNPTSSGTTAFLDFADTTWSTASITARGALIYLADGGTNPAVAVLDLVRIRLQLRATSLLSSLRLTLATLLSVLLKFYF